MKKLLGYSVIVLATAFVTASVYEWKVNNAIQEQLALLDLKAESLADRGQTVSYGVPAEMMDFTVAAEKTVNSVVHVKTVYEVNGGYYSFDPIRQFFFGDGTYRKPPRLGAGAGSGVFISSDGYIVTNNHVIDKAVKIEVTLNDNRTLKAELIGQDPSTDLAILKVEGKNFPYAEFGNSDQLKVGEWVLAVGNPFNLESTVTAGIVSAKGRDINILANSADGMNAVESFIQTDAAVNPGNSGGALVNIKGELVGINAAIKSNTGSYTGYSFAIPANIVSKVVEDMLEFGAVQRGFLGVAIQNIDQALAEKLNLSLPKGIYVNETFANGAAKDAGVKSGDVILKVGDIEVNTVTELQEQVSRYRPGDKVLLSLKRGNEAKQVAVVLRNKFGDATVLDKEIIELNSVLGAKFDDLSEDERTKLGLGNGVRVSSVGKGKLSSAGVQEGFIIQKVDQEKVTNKSDLISRLENAKGGVLLEGIYPNGKKAYYGFGL